MAHKVLISAPYMLREKEKVEALLAPHNLDVTWAPVKERLEEADLLPIVGQFDGIVCGDDRVTPKVIDAASRLKVVVKWGTGIDSIAQDYLAQKNIELRNTPNAFTSPVADTAVGMILSFSRGLFANDRLMKAGRWDKPQGYALSERVVGIIGFGAIGQAVAKRLMPFGCRVLANDIVSFTPVVEQENNVTLTTKENIYGECDFVTLHCDLNPESQHLLNASALAKLAKKPFVINTARGPLIEEKALVAALKSGQVAGAGLDVFEDEPLSSKSPLRKMDNVILSSHNSNSSPAHWDHVHQNSIKMLMEVLSHG